MKEKVISILDKAKYKYCLNDDHIVIDLDSFDLHVSCFKDKKILFEIYWDYYDIDNFVLNNIQNDQMIINTIKKMINRIDKIKKIISKSKIKLDKIKKELSDLDLDIDLETYVLIVDYEN